MIFLDKLTYLYQQMPMRFDLQVLPGERIAVLGPSGAGKSTLLNLIAGFLPADGGELRLNGKTIAIPRPPGVRSPFCFRKTTSFRT